MKPILVHVHIFYTQMWNELKQCLQNIDPYPFDLHVSLVQENEALQKDIYAFKQDAHIKIYENRGFDIAPFVDLINTVNLDNYDYIIKLHTKRNVRDIQVILNNCSLYGKRWRKYLLAFIETKQAFNNYLDFFAQNPHVGMVSSPQTIVQSTVNEPETQKNVNLLLKQHNITCEDFKFVAGTMFFARAFLFKQLQGFKVSFNNFEEITHLRNPQFAHIIERYLGAMVYSQGYVINSLEEIPIYQKYIGICIKFLYQNRITTSGKHLIKICKIPVYWKKVG